MKDFETGLGYLRKEARKSGFILESDNDDVLIERLSQMVRAFGPETAKEDAPMVQEAVAEAEAIVEVEVEEEEIEEEEEETETVPSSF